MTPDRRYDLDWIRITAFGLLILYHVGMFYVTWDWHVKSSHASHAIEPLMLLSNPWRLSLLFLVSGAASRFMADKMAAGRFTLARMGRLWPPLLLAVFVIVPPQTYYQVLEWLQAAGQPASPTLDDFWIRYASASGHWCNEEGCIATPTYNHMWFVVYLILYTLALIPLMPLLRRMPKALSLLVAGPGLFVTPFLVMFALRATLYPIYGASHDFRADWYLHPLYFSVFLFGFAIAKHQPFFDRCVRWRWLALTLWLGGWATLEVLRAIYAGRDGDIPQWKLLIGVGLHELQAWTAIIAAIGFAHRYLKHADGPVRRVLTQAIFPFYLIHQTIIVVAGHYLDELRLPLALEAPALIAVTALGCWLFYDLGRRVPALRVWIGLPSKPLAKRGKTLNTVVGEAG